jgi:hypothetical protein
MTFITVISLLSMYSHASANDFNNINGLQQNEVYAGAYLTFKFGAATKSLKKIN